MNIEAAQKILDNQKPAMRSNLYIDEGGKPRDKHIENLFRDCFYGRDLDLIFTTNFSFYFTQFTDQPTILIMPNVFRNEDAAGRWISQHIGGVTVKPFQPDPANPDFGEDFADIRFAAHIKPFGLKRDIPTAYSPTALHAVCLAAILVFRDEADRRLAKLFAEAQAKPKRKPRG